MLRPPSRPYTYSLAAPTEDVPGDVTTLTYAMPLPGGAMAVILLAESPCTSDPAPTSTNSTFAPSTKPLPSIVISLPPASGPAFALRPVTVGVTARESSAIAWELWPATYTLVPSGDTVTRRASPRPPSSFDPVPQ